MVVVKGSWYSSGEGDSVGARGGESEVECSVVVKVRRC